MNIVSKKAVKHPIGSEFIMAYRDSLFLEQSELGLALIIFIQVAVLKGQSRYINRQENFKSSRGRRVGKWE